MSFQGVACVLLRHTYVSDFHEMASTEQVLQNMQQ